MARWYGPGDPDYEPAALPTGLAVAGFAVDPSTKTLWTIGGVRADGPPNLVCAYDPASNEWQVVHELSGVFPTPEVRSVILDGAAFTRIDDGTPFVRLDLTTGSITTLAPPPDTQALDFVQVGGLIYWGVGGLTPAVYDPQADAWTPLDPGPYAQALGGRQAVTDGERIYSITSHDFVEYHPGAGTWRQLAEPNRTYHLGGFELLAGQIIAVAGNGGPPEDYGPKPWMRVYDIASDTWSDGPDAPLTVLYPATGVIDGRLYVAGGFDASNQPLDALMMWGAPPSPPSPVGDPRDRLRSSVSEDLGSILEAVEVVPVDASFSEHFTEAVSLEPSVRQRFRELFRDTHSDDVDFSYYPRPRQNTVYENQYDGITILSRLATWYPPRFFGTVAELGIPNDGGVATAQDVIQAVLEHWQDLQDWLQFEPVPDLRMPTGQAPDDYGPDDGLVTVETVTIQQEPDRRMTALDILRDLLSPFPGTVLRQNSQGKLVIIPIYGPDADEEPVVKLRDLDLYSISTGKPDPFSTINRATFTASGGYSRAENASVMQKAWFQVGSNYRLGDPAGSVWFEPPNDAINLQPPRDGDTVLQESLVSGQFGAQKPNLWPISPSSIPAGNGIEIEDGNGDPTISAAYRLFNSGGSLASSGTATVTILTPVIPFTGEWVDAWRVSFDLYTLTIRARWNEAAGGVELTLGPAVMEGNCLFGCWSAIVEFVLLDNSVAFTEATQQTSVTFGIVEDGDVLPGEDGGNAVEESQAAFGVRERIIHVRGYQLSQEVLAAAARGFVLHNITPRVTREVELSVAAAGITFDRLGRLVQLPNGETGILVGLDYSDDHTALAWSKRARVQLRDDSAPGATPTPGTVSFLLTTSGFFLMTTGFELFTLTTEEEE